MSLYHGERKKIKRFLISKIEKKTCKEDSVRSYERLGYEPRTYDDKSFCFP